MLQFLFDCMAAQGRAEDRVAMILLMADLCQTQYHGPGAGKECFNFQTALLLSYITVNTAQCTNHFYKLPGS